MDEVDVPANEFGEGSLNDLLTARRLANEAQLAARLSQLDALELRYRLLLDAFTGSSIAVNVRYAGYVK